MASLLKHTITPAGQGGDFNSLDACWDHLVASHADFVGADVYGEVEISGDWSGGADTAPVTAAGLTLDATRYLSIYTDEDNFAGPSWSDSIYRLLVANAVAIYKTTNNSDFVRFRGLQIGMSAVNANYQCPFYIEYTTNDDAMWWISNCLIKQAGAVGYRTPGIMVTDSQMSLKIWNTIVYNLGGTGDAKADSALYAYDSKVIDVFNSLLLGGAFGIYMQVSGVVNAKSVYVGGQSVEGFYREAGTINKTKCASADSSADDTSGADETATDCITGVALDTDTFVNVTGGSEDFHLAADGLSPLEGVGYDNSGESAPLDFAVDMDGDAMVNFSIGVDDGLAPATGITDAGAIGSGFAAGTAMMRGTIQSEV